MPLKQLKRNQPGFPAWETVKNYSLDKLKDDFLAGLTVSLLAIPQKIAYAIIAGLPPVHGIYAGGAGAAFGSIFGDSPYHITAPSGTYAIVVGGVLIGVRHLNYPPVLIAMYLAFLVGLIQISFALLKIGNLSRFVSLSVIHGFICGSAFVIIGDQVATIFELEAEKSPFFFSRFLEYLVGFIYSPRFPIIPVTLAAGAILGVVVLKKINQNLPAILLVALAGSAISYFFGLDTQVEVVGDLTFRLPDFPPEPAGTDLLSALFAPALALALLGSVQALSVAGSLAEAAGEELDENQELLGQGMANIGAGIFRGFPVSGSFTNSFLNYNAGARTRFAGVITGISMLVLVALFVPILYYIPQPLLAGLIVVIAYHIPDWKRIHQMLTTTRRDRIVFAGTILSVLLLQLDQAIYLGIVVSLMLHMRKATRPDMKEFIIGQDGSLKTIHASTERIYPQIAFVDITGEAFFGSAQPIKSRVKNLCEDSPELRVIILRLKNAMNLDLTAAQALKDLARFLRSSNRTLMVCGATPHIRKILDESSATEVIGRDKIFIAQKTLHQSTKQAMERAREHIDEVLEGDVSRCDEDPTLTYTMAEERDEKESNMTGQIREEKTGHHSNYDAEG